MSDDQKPEGNGPPVDPGAKEAGEFVLATRLLVKMGISFEDPRLKAAVTQLGIWPQLVFDLEGDEKGRPLAEVRVDEVNRLVEYVVVIAGKVPVGDELTKRTGALIGWTQQLLGEEWAVNVLSRTKKGTKTKALAKGERQRPVEAKPPTLTDAPFPDAVTGYRRYRTGVQDRFKLPVEDLGPIIRPKQ